MKTLLIIESPGKRKKLESILGAGYTVLASFGHIRDLPERELGVSSPDYRPQYVTDDDRAKKTVAQLKKAAAGVDRVLLATDPDREGEAIAWHVAEALKLKKRERITYGEITEKAVKAAVAAPRAIDMNLVHAQEARRVLDRLVGYRVSPALSDKVGTRLSAGRVQSPAVRLVVERERAIRAFTPTTHYGAALSAGTPVWKATWEPVLPDGAEYQLDAELAAEAAAVRQLRVESFQDGTSTAAPPAPFTTSTLQQAAQAALKLKPKQTMEVAQRLYEQGAITYMRTDSPNLSDEACEAIAAYAQANGLPLADKRRRWKAKGNAQEAHEAIRPSSIEDTEAGENEQEKALYRLIWARAVASQLAEATFATRAATFTSIELVGGGTAAFAAKGRTLTDPGWKALYDDGEDDEEAESSNPVPVLQEGQTVTMEQGEVLTKTTKAPKRYTLATLVKELEAKGIGRPATYAAILDNISRREYIAEDKKGFLSASPVAEQIVDALVGTFDFIELDYTRELEQDLDEVAEGRKTYTAVVAGADEKLGAKIGRLAPADSCPCPECGKPLRRRTGRNGPFWGCSGYPDCKVTLPDADGKPGERQAGRADGTAASGTSSKAGQGAESPFKCGECGKSLQHKVLTAEKDPKGRGWDFWGCTGYPKCKKTYKTGEDGEPILTT